MDTDIETEFEHAWVADFGHGPYAADGPVTTHRAEVARQLPTPDEADRRDDLAPPIAMREQIEFTDRAFAAELARSVEQTHRDDSANWSTPLLHEVEADYRGRHRSAAVNIE